MKNVSGTVLLGLLLSDPLRAQEKPPLVLSPAVYAVGSPAVSADSAAPSGTLRLIGSLPVSVGNFYGEVRYNYDADRTLGLYGGRTFRFGPHSAQSLIAQVGLLLGDYGGASVQVYYQLATARFELNSQQQVSMSWQPGNRPFYYTWSDAQWKAGRHLRAGLSVQVYRSATGRYTDGGLLVGYAMPRIFFTLYHFNIYRPGQGYALLAVQYTLNASLAARPARP